MEFEDYFSPAASIPKVRLFGYFWWIESAACLAVAGAAFWLHNRMLAYTCAALALVPIGLLLDNYRELRALRRELEEAK